MALKFFNCLYAYLKITDCFNQRLVVFFYSELIAGCLLKSRGINIMKNFTIGTGSSSLATFFCKGHISFLCHHRGHGKVTPTWNQSTVGFFNAEPTDWWCHTEPAAYGTLFSVAQSHFVCIALGFCEKDGWSFVLLKISVILQSFYETKKKSLF